MSTTDFTPERSAAIRQLLIDTVADEPRRRKRLQILLTSVLSGVALVLAGGTAALALSGVIHLGGGETPPAPVPSPTTTVTPTPTPTPTPTATPTERPLVQTAPVLPHDVDRLLPTTRWSLDLPGDPECTLTSAFTLSDARVVYVSGLRPKEYEGSDCINHLGEDFGLTLVDTSNGTVLWQREWKYASDSVDFGTTFEVLGTTGRAVFLTGQPDDGPHDVLDLATGRTIATFDRPGWKSFEANRDMRALADDSGDVVLIEHRRDADGRPVGGDVVTRTDPRDLAHPRWTRTLDVSEADLGYQLPGGTAMTLVNGQDVQTRAPSGGNRMLDLETGSTTPLDAVDVEHFSQILLARTYGQNGSPNAITAFDGDGAELWSREVPSSAMVLPAVTPGTVPSVVYGSGETDGGELFVADTQTLALIDQLTGAVRWSIPTPTCVKDGYQPFNAVLDLQRDVFLFRSTHPDCAIAHSSGDQVEAPALPWDPYLVIFGQTHWYGGYTGEADPGSAHDFATGDTIWTRERHDWETWSFNGGYLVSRYGNHIESIG